MAKKLLLVQCNVNRPKVPLRNLVRRFQPLGLGIIAALTPDDWEVEIIDETITPFKFKKADLVGISSLTASVNRAYEIAGFYREKGIPTVMGGSHVSALPEEALQYVDTVIIGEAESVWRQFISDLDAGNPQKIYRGELLRLEDIPRPRRDLYSRGYLIASIETTRGCPMNCEFCGGFVVHGRRYRERPIEIVLDELEAIHQDFVFFVDDNLIGHSKASEQRAIELCKGMIRRGINKKWFCQVPITVADNEELISVAAESGCITFHIGMEAVDELALQEINKKHALNRDYEKDFQLIGKYGIVADCTFMCGMDSDTQATIRQRADFILQNEIHAAKLLYYSPIPGTRLLSRLKDEGRLLYTDYPRDWERYNLEEVVHKPLQMNPQELRAVVNESRLKLYNIASLAYKFGQISLLQKKSIPALWSASTGLSLAMHSFSCFLSELTDRNISS